MTFIPEKVNEFLVIFEQSKHQIRAMKGCHHLELWQDYTLPNVFVTHSHWEDDDALNHYRNSELFRSTWNKTKVLFADKPVAFSSKSSEIV